MSTPLHTDQGKVILDEPLVGKVLEFVASIEPVPSRRLELARAIEIARVHWYSQHPEITGAAESLAAEEAFSRT